MELTDFQKYLRTFCPEISLLLEEPFSRHTSFRIGGNAEVMAFPKDVAQLQLLLEAARNFPAPLHILGAGSNILAPDAGLPGLTICLKDALDGICFSGSTVRIAAGVTMSRAAASCANAGLSGLEFAHGIPGTLGGGVYMNAGAYGGEMKDLVTELTVVTREGVQKNLSNADLHFSYRHSALEDSGDIVTSVTLQLTPKPSEEIWETMKALIAKRKASQPLDYPSAGSAFKRPATGYAAALIDQAGLKGYRVGNAAISQKHAGFAINLGGASSAQMLTLLQQVSEKVYEHSGVRLEPEVRIW